MDATDHGRILLIGGGRLADACDRALRERGAEPERLEEPSDGEIRAALGDDLTRVVVVSRYDHVSLRLALVVSHLQPDVSLLVTIFDRDVAAHLRETVAGADVLSMADVVAPALAAPCLDEELVSLVRAPGRSWGIVEVDGAPDRIEPTWSAPGLLARLRGHADSLLRPFDRSAAILIAGLAGVLSVLVLDTLVTWLARDVALVDAFYTVAKVIVTVGPSDPADSGPAWFKVFSAIAMLLTLGFAAVLTAGLVNRLLDRRLTGIIGRRAVPRRDHVIVVGLGQVGLRLCLLLRALDVPVVAIERNAEAKNVQRAKDRGLPVVIDNGSSQGVLRRVSIRSARGLAAVTSDEVENIATAIAARNLHPEITTVLRAGDGAPDSETPSLSGIGAIRDVYRIGGAALAAAALGEDVEQAFPLADGVCLLGRDGALPVSPPLTAPAARPRGTARRG